MNVANRRVLFTATIDDHFRCFHLPTFKWFKEQGWEVHVASNGDQQLSYVDCKFSLPFQRSPFHIANVKVYRQLNHILTQHDYTLIHCHTPMGGVLTRLAAKKARKQGSKVLYTAHGFHFYKGAPLLHWLLYYPIEKLLARYTDCLLTINSEDYERAIKDRFYAGRIQHVHGVGIDIERFKPISFIQKQQLRRSMRYDANHVLMFYAAEFNHNKNHALLLRAFAKISQELPNLKLLLAGEGPLLEDCKTYAKTLHIADKVVFLGYRTDVHSLLPMCDLAVSTSYREGLPVNVMEAMACGLPVVASNNRGHRELVTHMSNGYLVEQFCANEFAECIKQLVANPFLAYQFGANGRRIIEEKYSLHRVNDELELIYLELAEGGNLSLWATL